MLIIMQKCFAIKSYLVHGDLFGEQTCEGKEMLLMRNVDGDCIKNAIEGNSVLIYTL